MDRTPWSENIGWRIAFFIGPVLGLGIIYLRRHIPESPRWLVTHGEAEAAEKIVEVVERDVSVIMLFGGLVAFKFGIDAEGKALEDIAPLLSSYDEQGNQLTRLPV